MEKTPSQTDEVVETIQEVKVLGMNAGKILTLAVLFLGIRFEGQQTKPVISVPPPVPAAVEMPVATPQATNAAPADGARYILGPEDSVQITVFKEPTFSGPVPIRPDGMISLSLLGDIPAAGMTPMQLGADIATRLKKYVNDPSVTVTVLTVRPKQIYFVGEIGHVGPVSMTPGMTVLQAIATAGGLGPYAKSKNIYILRGEAGHQKKIPFNYKKALKEGNEQGISLVPGDTIVVP